MKKPQKPYSWPDCAFASFEALENCSKGMFRNFVWPDEGEFLSTGSFKFNQAHAGEFEPLMIDKISADMLLTLHNALNAENQARFKDWVSQDRGKFAALVEMAREKVTITGFKGRHT